jgi:sodium-coupled neutral amino acid transporter 11
MEEVEISRGYLDDLQTTLKLVRQGKVSRSRVTAAILNFTNSILGAGLMGIPYAFRQAGLIPGSLIVVLVAIVSGTYLPRFMLTKMRIDWSVGLMIKCGKRANARSYERLMGKAFGPVGSALCSLFQAIFALGCTNTAETLRCVIGSK